MRTKPQNPSVSNFAAQLQRAMENRGKKTLKDDSPEATALKILAESLRDTLLRQGEPKAPKVDRRATALRRWMERAKLGESAVFFGYTRMAFKLAAQEYGKEVSTKEGSFIFGKPWALQMRNKATMVTVIQDEDGNRLEDAEPDSDDGSGDGEEGVQEGGAESAS